MFPSNPLQVLQFVRACSHEIFKLFFPPPFLSFFTLYVNSHIQSSQNYW